MPRYFFHFVHRNGWVRDGEGTELPDLGSAHAHAALLVKQATAYFEGRRDWSGWLIRITDANDRSPLIVLFPAIRCAADLTGGPEACDRCYPSDTEPADHECRRS
jgi:hypothetical protein